MKQFNLIGKTLQLIIEEYAEDFEITGKTLYREIYICSKSMDKNEISKKFNIPVRVIEIINERNGKID
jgi:hypothetical protein